MNKTKHIPERMCVVCREMKPKASLVRIVNTTQGVVVDTTGKLSGRGVYVCKETQCICKLRKHKNFSKQYGFSLDDQVLAQLENIVE